MSRPTTDGPRSDPGADVHPADVRPRDVRDLTWPLLVTCGLLLVVLVNAAFIWIAVDGQDEVVQSYVTEPR